MPKIPESQEVWEHGEREFDRLDAELSRIIKALHIAVVALVIGFAVWLIL